MKQSPAASYANPQAEAVMDTATFRSQGVIFMLPAKAPLPCSSTPQLGHWPDLSLIQHSTMFLRSDTFNSSGIEQSLAPIA